MTTREATVGIAAAVRRGLVDELNAKAHLLAGVLGSNPAMATDLCDSMDEALQNGVAGTPPRNVIDVARYTMIIAEARRLLKKYPSSR